MDTKMIVAKYISDGETLSYEVCKDEEEFQEKAKKAKENTCGTIELKKLTEE